MLFDLIRRIDCAAVLQGSAVAVVVVRIDSNITLVNDLILICTQEDNQAQAKVRGRSRPKQAFIILHLLERQRKN